jgi:hypothetical protein
LLNGNILFLTVHKHSEGRLQVDDFPVWLINYEVPNQSNEKKRRADLLGLKLDGSLVVFECKVEDNHRDSPFRAVFEGLDYLGHLLVRANMEKLISGFDRWRKKPRNEDVLTKIPPQFRDVTVEREARHAVIVLAPESYFSFHQKDANEIPKTGTCCPTENGRKPPCPCASISLLAILRVLLVAS